MTYTRYHMELRRDIWARLHRCSDLHGRRTLRSADTSRLLVPPVRLSTVGSRAFTVAGPRIWNSLPEETTSAQSLDIPPASQDFPLQEVLS